MEGTEEGNLLESVLTAYNQRVQQTSADQIDCENDDTVSSATELSNHDVTKSVPGKRKAPTKPKRKASACTHPSNNILGDLDLGDPVDIQDIMDSVKAKNEGLPATNNGSFGVSSLDSPFSEEATETSSHSLSHELHAERNRLVTSDASQPKDGVDDQHIYSDVDHTWAVDLIPPSLPARPYELRNNSLCSLDRGNCSMEDISGIETTDNDSVDLENPGRLKASTSVQSDLNFLGIESTASPSKKLGRFGSRRRRNKKPAGDKDFGQFFDAAASNASNAYAKLRQLKKKAKENIKDSIPGRASQARLLKESERANGQSENSSTTANSGARREDGKLVKSGWLKKQGGVRKNWTDRWFLLTETSLYYYKDRDEAKLCGTLPIIGSNVDENPTTSEANSDKFLFEIISDVGKKNQNSQTFAAATKNDKDSWIKAIKKVMSGPSLSGVFGQSLSHTIHREKNIDVDISGQRNCGKVPCVVIKCCEFIRENKGFSEEGLFRLPGNADEVQELRDAFDSGQIPTFDIGTDVNTITSLLKSYLRELPEPVVPFDMYTPLIDAAKAVGASKQGNRRMSTSSDESNEQAIEVIKSQLESLPEENFHLLRYLSRFLDEVQQYSLKNKMDTANLALMFGPNILRSKDADPVTMMSHSTYVQYVMSQFIINHKHYFGEVERIEVQSPPISSIPDVAADADRQDLSIRVCENNISNVMKSRVPKIGPAHPNNGTASNYLPRRTSPQKPLRLTDHGNRPVLPPKPKVKPVEVNGERYDTIPRMSSANSYVTTKHTERKTQRSSTTTIDSRPSSQISSQNSQGSSPSSSQRHSSEFNLRNSMEESAMIEGVSPPLSPRRSTVESCPADDQKVPHPPARRRKSVKDSVPTRPSSTSSHITGQTVTEVFETDSASNDIRSVPGSRTGSVSGSSDITSRERTRSGASVPRRPTGRPPPPPDSLKNKSTNDPTKEELKETIRILTEKLRGQSEEFQSRLRRVEEDLVAQIRGLCRLPLLDYDQFMSQDVADSKKDLHANRLSNEFSTGQDEKEVLRERILEERRLRQMAEIQLKNEKRGREAAEQRNIQLLNEIQQFRSLQTS